MAFSYNPNLETNKDKVRFYIQDNKEDDFFFEDEEIEQILVECGNNPKSTSISLCYTLAALFASVPDMERVGPYTAKYEKMSEKYTKLATALRAQQNRLLNGYAGGLYREETIQTLMNSDLTKNAFHKFMMRNYRLGGVVGI